MLDAFRNEIVESEKNRTELLKWKLFLVSAIGSVALGFGEMSNPVIFPPLLLCFIPLICVFVDALCRHLQLRILAIFEMITCFSSYEKFCNEIRKKTKLGIFDLEDWAMEWSTSFASGLLVVGGPFISQTKTETSIFICSGLIGISLSLFLDSNYKRKRSGLSGVANGFFQKRAEVKEV